MEVKRVWLKEDTFALINIFEGYPELWQIKSKIYRDRVRKQNALKVIADKFDTTEAEIQRKLHNLRTQANQEWSKIKKRKSGQGTDEIYRSSWEYFESLKFLVDQHIPLQAEDNLTDISEYTATTSLQLQTPVAADGVKRCKKKRDNDVIDKATELKAMAELNKPDDEFSTFGDFVSSELRSLQYDHNRRKLKRIIQKAVLDISEIDDNERSSSALSTHSHTSVNSQDSQVSIYSAFSPPPTNQLIQSHTSQLFPIHGPPTSCTNSNSSSSQYYQELEPRSEPHNTQGLSLREYIREFETST